MCLYWPISSISGQVSLNSMGKSSFFPKKQVNHNFLHHFSNIFPWVNHDFLQKMPPQKMDDSGASDTIPQEDPKLHPLIFKR